MPKEKSSGDNLLSAQRILFRAFFVNTVLVFLVWLMTFIQGFIFLGVVITGVSAPMTSGLLLRAAIMRSG